MTMPGKIFIATVHSQLFAQTTVAQTAVCTDNCLHIQLFAQTAVCTDNCCTDSCLHRQLLHRQLFAQTTVCTDSCCTDNCAQTAVCSTSSLRVLIDRAKWRELWSREIQNWCETSRDTHSGDLGLLLCYSLSGGWRFLAFSPLCLQLKTLGASKCRESLLERLDVAHYKTLILLHINDRPVR